METAEKNTSSPPLFVFEEPLKKSSSRKGMILTAFFILILGGIPAATLMLQNTQVLRSRATSASLAAANLTLPEGTNCDFSRSPFICTTKSQEFDIELVSAPDEFTVEATDVSNCRGSLTEEEANSYLIGGQGSFNIATDSSLELPKLVRFDIPSAAPACTIVYNINVDRDTEFYTGAEVFVTIK